MPLEAAGRQRALGGPLRHGDGGGDRRGSALGQRLEVVGDGADVAAADRSGEPAVTAPETVVERGGQQRAQDPRGVVDAGGAEQVGRLGDQRDQVVRAGDQGGVVEPPVLLGFLRRVA